MVVEIMFSFLVGLTIAGMTASTMELTTGSPISFKGPYISLQRPAQSLLASAAAGPLMLANDALEAYRGGRIPAAGLAVCTVAAIAWATAIGTVVVGLAARAVVSLS